MVMRSASDGGRIFRSCAVQEEMGRFSGVSRRKKLLIRKKLLLILLYSQLKEIQVFRKREYWVHPILQKREENEGEFSSLVKDMRELRTSFFFTAFRMTPQVFDKLLGKVKSKISKQVTRMRKPVSAEERLCVTLRFLATGDSYFTIGASYRMSRSVVSKIVKETCSALWDVLQPEVMPAPDTAMWSKIASEFEDLWQYPHCLGSIDGKHIVTQAPAASGSQYFNYKKSHSIVLMAVVDAQYNFVAVDVGAYGRQSDSNVFANSCFGRLMKDGQLPLPSDQPLPGCSSPSTPYVFVGDEAFPLHPNLMRPYPGNNLCYDKRVFNYRLSRARRTVENAFGILASRFRCFRRPLLLKPANAEAVVRGAVVLHNFLRREVGVHYAGPGSVDHEDGIGTLHPGQWRHEAQASQSQLLPMRRVGRRSVTRATQVRDHYKDFFSSEIGSVAWQDSVVKRTN